MRRILMTIVVLAAFVSIVLIIVDVIGVGDHRTIALATIVAGSVAFGTFFVDAAISNNRRRATVTSLLWVAFLLINIGINFLPP